MDGEAVGGNKYVGETLTVLKVETSECSHGDRFVILCIICRRLRSVFTLTCLSGLPGCFSSCM
jgi:hypothetical protein